MNNHPQHGHADGKIVFRIGGIRVQATFNVTFTIAPSAPPISLGQSSFAGQVGQPLSGSLAPTGGSGGPYVVNVTDPTQLPPGVTIDGAGEISGTPTAEGTFNTGITVADSQG